MELNISLNNNNNNIESNLNKINLNINNSNLKSLTICSITWNMHGECPSNSIIFDLLSPHLKERYDIYCIGSEECLRSIFKSLFYSDKSYWEISLSEIFNKNFYYLFSSYTLAAIHLVIFVKIELKKYIKLISTNEVKTGGYNLIGNKGGVSILLNIYNLNIMIINCHLAARKDYSTKRNDNFKRIVDKFITINKQIDFIIFMGDLNYRLNTDKFNIETIKQNYKEYLIFDQLIFERNNNRLKVDYFLEGEINFLPTFKYKNGTDEFDNSKKDNNPAWTDRILFLKKNTIKNVFDVSLKKYDSMQNIIMSDHKPVYAYFELIIQN